MSGQGGAEGRDLTLNGLQARERAPGSSVPVYGVAPVGLGHVDDAMAPRAELARVGLGNGVGPMPVAGLQEVQGT